MRFTCDKIKTEIGNFKTENKTYEKHLGIPFDKTKILTNAFFDSHLKYCPLI